MPIKPNPARSTTITVLGHQFLASSLEREPQAEPRGCVSPNLPQDPLKPRAGASHKPPQNHLTTQEEDTPQQHQDNPKKGTANTWTQKRINATTHNREFYHDLFKHVEMELTVGPRIQVTIPTDAGIVSENQLPRISQRNDRSQQPGSPESHSEDQPPRTSQHNNRSQQPGSPEYHSQGEETIAKEKEAEPPETILLPATIPYNASKHPNLQLPTWDNTEEGNKFVTKPVGIKNTQAALGQPPGSWNNTEEENKSIAEPFVINDTQAAIRQPPYDQYLNKYQYGVQHDKRTILETSSLLVTMTVKNNTADGRDPRVLRDPKTLRPQGSQEPQDLRTSDQTPVKPDGQVKPGLDRLNQVQPSPATNSNQLPTVTSFQQSPITHSHQSPTVTLRHQPSHGKPVPPQIDSPTGPIKLKRLNNTVRHKGGTYNNNTVRHKGGTYNNQDYTKIVRSRNPPSLYPSNLKRFHMSHGSQISQVIEGFLFNLFSGI